MNRTIGLIGPLLALVLFGIFYLPILSRFLPSGWLRLPLSPQIFFLVSALVILKLRKATFSEIGLAKTGWARHVGLGLVVGLSPVALTLLLSLLLTKLHGLHPFLPRPIFGGAPFPGTIQPYDLVTLLLLAPICEELFFRGVLFKALGENYSTWLTVVGSALIFMGAHGKLGYGPFILGLLSGVLVVKTRSILPCVVFHIIANAYGPVMITWFPNLYRYVAFFYS